MNANFKNISSFDRHDRIDKYKESSLNEKILDALNSNLFNVEQLVRASVEGVPRRSIIITGTPRSGSTFLYQSMASRAGFGYVSNLMARFYSAPLVGAWLQNQLIKSEISELSKFSSTHGVTDRVYEPHEFGFFWGQHMPFIRDNHEDVDNEVFIKSLIEMENKLSSIAGVFGRTVVYKCMIAPFVLESILENTSVFVVHIKRNIDEVIDSILEVRKERLGSYDKWWSIRPAGWRDVADLDSRKQVRYQCESVLRAIELGVSAYPHRVIEVDYRGLVNDIDSTLGFIVKKYNKFYNS